MSRLAERRRRRSDRCIISIDRIVVIRFEKRIQRPSFLVEGIVSKELNRELTIVSLFWELFSSSLSFFG